MRCDKIPVNIKYLKLKLYCPKCDSNNLDRSSQVFTSFPPQYCYTCLACGEKFYSSEIHGQIIMEVEE